MTAGGATAGVRLETILPLALPSLSVRENEPLGLYWEMELPSDAVATEMTVTLAVEYVGERPGFLGRVVRGIFGGGGSGSRVVSWQIQVPRSAGNATPVVGASIAFPTRGLARGEYLVAVQLAGANGLTATTERRIILTK